MAQPHKPKLRVHQTNPFNAGPPPAVLGAQVITPNSDFFVRSHAPIPIIEAEQYRLRILGKVSEPLTLSVDDLKTTFPRYEVMAVLQCAGYRRRELEALGPIPNEIIWDTDAVGVAVWAGARLYDVLQRAGVDTSAKHVAFIGLDAEPRETGLMPYGGSIPMEKAIHPDTLLVYEMNGEPLPPEHGFPLRVVVPGYIGARSVKWLGQIVVQDEPSDNYYQRRAYRQFSPMDKPESADWESAPMLGDLRLNVVVVEPLAGDTVTRECLIRGFAWAGEGYSVAEVSVSSDGGATWQLTQLEEDAGPWAWRPWQLLLQLPIGDHTLIVRAKDTSGQMMPLSLKETWNFKGYMNNACPHITVHVRA